MRPDQFTSKKTGRLVPVDGIPAISHAFVPDPLPPNWAFPQELVPLLVEARSSLSNLDGIGSFLPNPELLLRPLQNREAQKSSSLEGTVTEPDQQLLFEIEPRVPDSDRDPINAYMEVANYGTALRVGTTDGRIPLSLRLIRNLHGILLKGVRGSDTSPGEFRTVQNQVGRPPRYVPPPLHYMNDCLNDFEHYLHQARRFDPLVDAFLVHYQFEAIHPFRDGNGRVGRLLLALTIKEWCDLDDQWLYMSAYFDANKDTYIDTLFKISTHGAWKEWIEFCLVGVREQSRDAADRCQQLRDLSRSYDSRLGQIKGSYRLNTIVDNLFTRPIVQIPEVATKLDVTYPTAKSDVEKLVDVGILEELDEISPRTFFAKEIYNITYAD